MSYYQGWMRCPECRTWSVPARGTIDYPDRWIVTDDWDECTNCEEAPEDADEVEWESGAYDDDDIY
jgi:hypothetical protein